MRLSNLSTLQELKELNPLVKYGIVKYTKSDIPSNLDLILLATNLLYKGKKILDGELKAPKKITAMDYTYEAIKLHNIVDRYETHYLTKKEFTAIRKKFKLNDLYK